MYELADYRGELKGHFSQVAISFDVDLRARRLPINAFGENAPC